MPKQWTTTNAARDRRALFRVAVRDGLAAATYGRSRPRPRPRTAGAVLLRTKTDLIHGALFELGRRVIGRGLDLIAQAGPDPSPETMLRSAVAGSRPVDDTSREELVLFFLFYVAALSDQSVAESGVIAAQQFITTTFAEWITTAQARGEVAPEVDPLHEADWFCSPIRSQPRGPRRDPHGR